MLRRDVELFPAGLARYRIVDADHVIAELGEQRPVALVGASRDGFLARAHDPAHLVLVDAFTPRTGQLVGARLVFIVEEVAFVERHRKIILLFRPMSIEAERTYPSELPVLALRHTVMFPFTLQPLSVNRPVSIA